jgi:hypothetical protein
MARGAAQARRKQPAKQAPKRKQRAAPTWEQQMFFPRLRRQAKWVFVFLALVFGVGFVAFGVGSGSTGISDVLRGNFFGGGGSSVGSQITKAQKRVKSNPKDTDAYLRLAALYQQDNKIAKQIATLQSAPKNYEVLSNLAGVYSSQAQQSLLDYQNAQRAAAGTFSTPPYVGTLAQVFSQDPLTQALQGTISETQSKAVGALRKAETGYRAAAKTAAGTSNEASAQLQLANIAVQGVQNFGQPSDALVAIAAYKRYLKLEPNAIGAAQARQTLAQLRAFVGKGHG